MLCRVVLCFWFCRAAATAAAAAFSAFTLLLFVPEHRPSSQPLSLEVLTICFVIYDGQCMPLLRRKECTAVLQVVKLHMLKGVWHIVFRLVVLLVCSDDLTVLPICEGLFFRSSEQS